MENQDIIQMISNYGFPVLMCLMLFYYIKTEQKNTITTLQELRISIEKNTDIIETFLRGEKNGKK